jgi:DNA replication licensing factor MCM4
MELQEEVLERHVQEAMRLMKVSMQQSAMDHRTGMIDMDKLYSGVGALDREMRRHLAVVIAELLTGAFHETHSLSTTLGG